MTRSRDESRRFRRVSRRRASAVSNPRAARLPGVNGPVLFAIRSRLGTTVTSAAGPLTAAAVSSPTITGVPQLNDSWMTRGRPSPTLGSTRRSAA